eukprot:CAMPEP_0172517612 /NCGR_PEP_ID=MMETSP1066-20121228/286493_1 /TAXON_ID=671091 /ORGANISM="Coscinodiscus wailesii, Strain CCMP2513" /LENGTH=30 /DNA_ID= /DNA_START= /DNA_END= /DNA_ORIENTATION=
MAAVIELAKQIAAAGHAVPPNCNEGLRRGA